MAQKKQQSGATSRKLGASNATGRKSSQRATTKAPLIDSRSKRDILGVFLIVLAIVLFIVAILTPTGVVTTVMSQALHYGLGIGAYMLPLFILAIGVSFLIRSETERLSTRVALGLLVVFIGVLGLIALFSPAASQGQANLLFTPECLVSFGGYIGSGIAWVGVTLLGQIVSIVIMIGIIITGFIIVGVSISGFIQSVREKALRSRYNDDGPLASIPFARINRTNSAERQAIALDTAPTQAIAGENPQSMAETVALNNRKLKKPQDKKQNLDALPAIAPESSKNEIAASKPAQGRKAPTDDQSLTRKLGKQEKAEKAEKAEKKSTPQAKSGVLDRIKKMPVLPLATPIPQEGFELPPYEILDQSDPQAPRAMTEEMLKEAAEKLQTTLEDFGVFAQVVGWVAGPTVTLFKVDLPHGVRVSKVVALSDDIALSLASPGVRIFAPIPNTNYVGIELPNKERENVLLGDILKEAKPGPLQMAIGKDVDGNFIISNLAAMPHLLIGGTTGSGKTISIHSMIISILMRATPSEVRFIMIDPKRVEFMRYNGIPHLYVPVVTEPKEAASALSWGVAEMERRLKTFSKAGASNIGQYNAKVQNGMLEGAQEVPYVVIIVDELADLMMNCGKEVEFSISRIAQLARAAGIHLIIATQRPSAKVVTGLIKANITNRIALTVASSIDSRVILDCPGADKLIGRGDMLFSKPEWSKPQRLQGCYVTDEETYAVVEFLKEQGEPEYHSEILQTNLITLGASQPDGSGGAVEADDPLLWEAADIVVSSNLGSTSNIQRRLKVGYSRAGRIMDMLEEKGVVGPANGSKPRDVLVDALELETLKAFEQHDAR